MKFFERQLVTYTAWLCRTFGVTPRQINKGRVDNDYSFVPRPEGALGNYY
jgi:hypothetical protein